jgi:hypothetical protein
LINQEHVGDSEQKKSIIRQINHSPINQSFSMKAMGKKAKLQEN